MTHVSTDRTKAVSWCRLLYPKTSFKWEETQELKGVFPLTPALSATVLERRACPPHWHAFVLIFLMGNPHTTHEGGMALKQLWDFNTCLPLSCLWLFLQYVVSAVYNLWSSPQCQCLYSLSPPYLPQHYSLMSHMCLIFLSNSPSRVLKPASHVLLYQTVFCESVQYYPWCLSSNDEYWQPIAVSVCCIRFICLMFFSLVLTMQHLSQSLL